MKVVIINGRPQSGKDTFIGFCQEYLGSMFVKYCHFAEMAKDIAKKCGWNGEKDDKSRWFLAELTRIMTEYNDYPFKSICKNVQFYREYFDMYDVGDKAVVFVCVREPNIIQKFKEEFERMNIPVITLFIKRGEPDYSEGYSNMADWSVNRAYAYDVTIKNDDNIGMFHEEAMKFCKEYLEGDR